MEVNVDCRACREVEMIMNRREFVQVVGGASVLAVLPSGCAMLAGRGGLGRMRMSPFNNTLMGVTKGVLDYYGLSVSDASLYGCTGQAFLINIHRELCPSGPYVWNHEGHNRLLENLGVKVVDLGFFTPKSSDASKAELENQIREAMDAGNPCSLLNLENQLITGYNSKKFYRAQPWAPENDFPPARLSYGSWKELGKMYHVTFCTYEKVETAKRTKAIVDSLDYAIELHTSPADYSKDEYGIGPDAYSYWMDSATEHGSSHGNWWNAVVWAECRKMAAAYFEEIGQEFASVAGACAGLTFMYTEISETMVLLSDKEMDPTEKVSLLRKLRRKESEAIKAVTSLANTLRPGAV